MELNIRLEEICIGHIGQPRSSNCQICKIDEYNKYCPNYLSQKEAIRLYRPEYKLDGCK